MSPSTGKRYPLTLICSVWQVARSSVYACRTPTQSSMPQTRKRLSVGSFPVCSGATGPTFRSGIWLHPVSSDRGN